MGKLNHHITTLKTIRHYSLIFVFYVS